MENNIDSFVLSGGGHIGFYQLGALYNLKENGFMNKNKIKNIFSCSAGSMCAIMFCLDYDKNELFKYIIERPWENVFEIKLSQMIGFYNNNGLFNIEFFESIINSLLLGKSLSTDITLKEFYEFSNINIYFHTTELISMKLEIISHENYPDLPLIKALYMSCAIPMVFSPCFYNEKCFIDGGLLNNYPLSTYFEKYPNNINNVIGFRSSKSSKKKKPKKLNSNDNILDLLSVYTNHFINKLQTKKNKIDIKYELEFNVGPINEKDFIGAITCKESREKYLNDGYKEAEIFLGKYKLLNISNINNIDNIDNIDISNNYK
mgnify:CR=1 FL=1|jgi:predicted acylesterase/phospholipase RssA